jgi:hypothetical protein
MLLGRLRRPGADPLAQALPKMQTVHRVTPFEDFEAFKPNNKWFI